MTRAVIYATPSTSVRMAMQMMLTHKVSGLAVVDSSNRCVGVYSELDAMLQGSSQKLDIPIKYVKPAKTVQAQNIFRDVLIKMVQLKIKRMPVVDAKGFLVGVVSRRDLMRAIYDDVEKTNPVKKSK